jgi:hypothetical protein
LLGFWAVGHGHLPGPGREGTPPARVAGPSAASYATTRIEDLQPGDTVLAVDPATGEVGPRQVLQVFRRTTYHLRILTFRDPQGSEQTLQTTDEHPRADSGDTY